MWNWNCFQAIFQGFINKTPLSYISFSGQVIVRVRCGIVNAFLVDRCIRFRVIFQPKTKMDQCGVSFLEMVYKNMRDGTAADNLIKFTLAALFSNCRMILPKMAYGVLKKWISTDPMQTFCKNHGKAFHFSILTLNLVGLGSSKGKLGLVEK